ncbi:AbfB domain-containing protein [Symbioplanes lichenis]|uniref:AbfB domain-containing protein n=1 Tax=Symbioplanes lichenis TaxID=1629072 RepID=UPI00273A3A37|nr:AbfB domain-containing protein [Actinoplanes lichenis]
MNRPPWQGRITFTYTRIIAGGAALTVAVMAILIGSWEDGAPQSAALPVVEPTVNLSTEPVVPVPIVTTTEPAPAGAWSDEGSRPLPVSRTSPAARTSAPGPRSSRPSPTPSPVRLDTRISLVAEPADGVPVLLRHRDFRLRLDPVSTRSDALSRADATFVLRRGLADAKCFSLESINYPGFFVRHRHFRILLTRPDGAADATFCPEPAGATGRLSLRSVNYPDRRIAASGDELMLAAVSAGGAQRFRMTSPVAP